MNLLDIFFDRKKIHPKILSPELAGLLDYMCGRYKIPAFTVSGYLYLIQKICLQEKGRPVFADSFHATCFGPQIKEVVEILGRFGTDFVSKKFDFSLFCEGELVPVGDKPGLVQIVELVFEEVSPECGHLVTLTHDDAWGKNYLEGNKIMGHHQIKAALWPGEKRRKEEKARKHLLKLFKFAVEVIESEYPECQWADYKTYEMREVIRKAEEEL